MVRPKATGKRILVFSWNFFEAMTECIDTICGLTFGTSIPTVPLPGIGAMIRMPTAESDIMISFSRF